MGCDSPFKAYAGACRWIRIFGGRISGLRGQDPILGLGGGGAERDTSIPRFLPAKKIKKNLPEKKKGPSVRFFWPTLFIYTFNPHCSLGHSAFDTLY